MVGICGFRDLTRIRLNSETKTNEAFELRSRDHRLFCFGFSLCQYKSLIILIIENLLRYPHGILQQQFLKKMHIY